MGGRYDIMQRIKEVLEASDPLNYGNAEQARTIEVSPAPQLSPDPRLEALANPLLAPTTPPPPPAAAAAPGQGELIALLREGRKIMAVKRYRELTGSGLAEAKAAIDALEQRLEAGEDAPSAPPPAPVAPDMDALAARVVALVQGGNTIEAIKVYREVTNVGLREAKEAVEAIEDRLRQAPPSPPPAPFAAPPPPPASVPPAPSAPRQSVPVWLSPVVEQLRRGNKIEAIKAYRDATGVGLAEAKATVEALERQLASQWRG